MSDPSPEAPSLEARDRESSPVRTGIQGLTPRGRAFAAAGVTTVACAMVLGQESLVRVGALVMLLPLLGVASVALRRVPLIPTRTVTPSVVTCGQPASVTLELTTSGNGAAVPVLAEDRVPYALGSRPRFVLETGGPLAETELDYPIRSDLRGRFTIGPLVVRVSDPFGLVEVTRSVPGTTEVVIVPRTVPLPSITLNGTHRGTGDNRPRAFSSGSAEDITVREYRTGDDQRRIHWRSTARTGQLMVRHDEQPWQSRATVLLDNRAGSHRGQGPASSLETAVSHAASIIRHLGERGYAVRLVTADGAQFASTWHERGAATNTQVLLEELAVVEARELSTPVTTWLGEADPGIVVGVFGEVTEHDRAMLRRIRTAAPNALTVVVDVEAWAGRPQGAAASALPRALGWRAVTTGPGDGLEPAWLKLGPRGHQRQAGAQ